jgi:hypothetical protein
MTSPYREFAARARRALPLLAAVVICAMVIKNAGWGAITDSIYRARYDWFIPLSVVYALLNFNLDCFGQWVLVNKSVLTVPLREVKLVRAVTQLVGSVNVWVGQAGMSYYFAKRSGLPMAYLGGMNILQWYTDLACAFIFCGMAFNPGGGPRDPWLALLIGAGITMLPVLLIARMVSRSRLGDLKGQAAWFTRSALRQMFAPIFMMPIHDFLMLFAARMPRYPLKAVYLFITMWCFHVEVPVRDGLVLATLAALSWALPLTPQGLGVLQVAGLLLFIPYGSTAGITAALLMVSMVHAVSIVIYGMYYLRGGMELLRDPGKFAVKE